MSNEVPEAWEKQWAGPENPVSWVRIANRKGISLAKWVQRVQAKSLMKETIGLNDLFHPETFLNAFRQRNARLQKVAIDELKLVSNFK
jgi:dynein heavy chain 2